MTTTDKGQALTYGDVLGLASIGARLYEHEDEDEYEIGPKSIAEAERSVWSWLFTRVWPKAPEEWREDVRRELAMFGDELDRAIAIADAERREQEWRTDALLGMTFAEAKATTTP